MTELHAPDRIAYLDHQELVDLVVEMRAEQTTMRAEAATTRAELATIKMLLGAVSALLASPPPR